MKHDDDLTTKQFGAARYSAWMPMMVLRLIEVSRQFERTRSLVASAMKHLMAAIGLAILSAQPSPAESVPLEELHGVYMVPVRINDAITIPFVLDSGAGDISVPEDVFKTLIRARTIRESDFLAPGTYVTADGSRHTEQRFVLHEVRVGDQVVKDVVASVAPDKADPLLGQSFLKKLTGWSIDNQAHTLVLRDSGSEPQVTTAAPVPAPSSGVVTPPQSSAPPPPENTDTISMGLDAYGKGDYATAMAMILPTAQTGDPAARYYVGLMFLKGQGVQKNPATALSWLSKSATSGHAYAQTYMGALNRRGEIMPQNYDAAMHWYLLAAKRNFKNAQYSIARMYYFGQGVQKDVTTAYMWAVIASTEGEPTFSQFRLKLEKSLSEAEIAEGHRRGAAWQAANTSGSGE